MTDTKESFVPMGDDAQMDENEAIIPALREWGPDVSDPPYARTRDYIHPDLEREVMRVITRYPQSRLNEDGTTHGLAAVAAVLAVEQWLLAHQEFPDEWLSCPRCSKNGLGPDGNGHVCTRCGWSDAKSANGGSAS